MFIDTRQSRKEKQDTDFVCSTFFPRVLRFSRQLNKNVANDPELSRHAHIFDLYIQQSTTTFRTQAKMTEVSNF
jgi:hypothetical protein